MRCVLRVLCKDVCVSTMAMNGAIVGGALPPKLYDEQSVVASTLLNDEDKELWERLQLLARREAGMAAQGFAEVVVATDDARIAEAAEGFGARVVMTPESCRNGTERCAAALPMLESDPDVIVNLQGDAPLTPPWFLEALRDAMADQSFDVATPVLRCDAEAHAAFLEDRAAGRVGGTTAVFDRSGRALYFSKEVIPYTGRAFAATETCPVFHHVGVYAYRPGALPKGFDVLPAANMTVSNASINR